MSRKVSIIGSGNVGTNAALFVAEKNIADVQLIDIQEGLPQGKCLDLMEAAPIRGYDHLIEGSNDLADLAGSYLVVIAAGEVRTPWMEREDVLSHNAAVLSSLAESIAVHAPSAKVIVVTEPVDAMTYLIQKKTGFPRFSIMGMAGILDSERLRYFIAEQFGVSVLDTTGMVIGGHHNYMIPLLQYCRIAGIPIAELLDEKQIGHMIERVKRANEEILNMLKTSSSCIAAAAAVAEIVEIIVRNERRIVSVPVCLEGEYGYSNICLGVPVLLGEEGVVRIIELKLTPRQKDALRDFADLVRDSQQALASLS